MLNHGLKTCKKVMENATFFHIYKGGVFCLGFEKRSGEREARIDGKVMKD